MSSLRNVLVLRFSSLGDVILLTSLLEALHHRYPSSRVWLATKLRYAPLFSADARVHRVVPLEDAPGALTRLVSRLETVDFDLVLDAHDSLRSRLLTWLLPPARTVRLRKDAVARMLFVRARLRSRALRLHLVDRYLAMLGGVGGEPAPRLELQEADRAGARAIVPAGAPLLAVAPGARHGPKRWPVESYAEVTRRFLEQGLGRIALVGGPDEEELCARIAAELRPSPLVLAGDQDLRTLAAVLESCRMLLCNDSGLMHLAEAVGTPVLAVFGPTSRELGFFPRHPYSRVVEQTLPCRPCSRTGARPCHMPERWCMTRSTPTLVYGQLEEQWQRLGGTNPATSR